jgi:hypothetical protein
MQLYDLIELVADLPDEGLSAGAVGTVVHIFDAPNLAYEVEFTDHDGRTLAQVPLTPDQIRPAGEFHVNC